MGFRFRKSLKIMPGVRVNVSKTGFSTSLGSKGFTANVSKRGVRGTVGIPGSGLSYSGKVGGNNGSRRVSHVSATSETSEPTSSELEQIGGVALLFGFGGPFAFAFVAAESIWGWFGWFLTLSLFAFVMLAIGRASTVSAPVAD